MQKSTDPCWQAFFTLSRLASEIPASYRKGSMKVEGGEGNNTVGSPQKPTSSMAEKSPGGRPTAKRTPQKKRQNPAADETPVSTPVRDNKKQKQQALEREDTPPKHRTAPARVDSCRPVGFAQPVKQETTLEKPKKRKTQTDAQKQTTRTDAEEADLLKVGDESDPEDCKRRGIKREGHQRTCHKKTVSTSELRSAGTRMHLALIGVTWAKFQASHKRHVW